MFDILTLDVLLCIIVGMTSVHIMLVSICTVVDIMTISNADLYVLVRSSHYNRI